jgi:hypothetical protein
MSALHSWSFSSIHFIIVHKDYWEKASMNDRSINLKKEQEATLARPRYCYSATAKLFFWLMDVVTGSKVTLAKTKLIETLASIPYREWEFRQYLRMTRKYSNPQTVEKAKAITEWGREAQDNEYWHLLVINEKMREDGKKDKWYLTFPITFFMVLSYSLFARFMAAFNIKRAFLFNAEFEDHAEHVYAAFVADHPEWENQPVDNEIVRQYTDATTWADVFRRIGLDERNHMNNSFVFCGQSENVVQYDGMPEVPNI